MPQLTVAAVLFDLDGTLVDSTGSVERNWRKLSEGIGVPWPQVQPWIHGIPVPQVLARLRPDFTPEQVATWRQFMIDGEATDTDDVVPIPGALTALDTLPTSRWAIVTSGPRRLALARINAAGLPVPRHLVTADDVTVGKPDPAPFLLGAKTVGAEPIHCVAFEDSPAGVQSARAAGMEVIALTTTHPQIGELGVPTITDLTQVGFSADRAGVVVSY